MAYCEKEEFKYDIKELIKRKFGFSDITCHNSSENKIIIEVTYNNFDWKGIRIECTEGKEYIVDSITYALNENRWDHEYTLHTNTRIVREIIDLLILEECGYYIHENVLCNAHFKGTGMNVPCDNTIVDLETVNSLTYISEDDELTILKLVTDEGTYQICEDRYTFTQKKSA